MPSINGGMKLVKYLLFLFNLAFVALGIALVWIGFSAKHKFPKYLSTLVGEDGDGGHSIPPTIFIAVGIIMFLIAFLGCCGAVTENHCMTMLYSVLVGLILVIQLGAAIAAYAFQGDIENVLDRSLNKTITHYYDGTGDAHNETVSSWNFLQANLHCCGVKNYTDWSRVSKPPTESFIPEYCCIGGKVEGCTKDITMENLDDVNMVEKKIFIDGCLPKAIDLVSINHLGTVGIVFGVIQVLGIICACMMARSIRFSYETV